MNLVTLALRAALLDGRVYEEAARKPEAVFQSLAIVAAAGVAFGVGLLSDPPPGADGSPYMVTLLGLGTVMLGWLMWSVISHVAGSLVLAAVRVVVGERAPARATLRQVMRTLGVGFAPGLLTAAVALPTVGPPLSFVGLAWLLACGIVALRHVQDLGWAAAVVTGTLGWMVAFMLLPAFLLVPGPAS